MKDAFEIKGYWWLPESPENKLPGTLSFSQRDGALLKLIGVFGVETDIRINQPIIILGITQQQRPVSLYKCFYLEWSLPLMGIGGCQYHVHFVFDGVHFESKAQIKFSQLYGNYTDLDAWIGIYGFSVERENAENKFSANIKYEKPSAQFFDIGDTFEAGIDFSSQGPNLSTVQTKVKISQPVYLTVKSKTGEINFDTLFSQLNVFSDLLQVAVQRAVSPVSIFGLSRETVVELDGREPYYPEINIYYQPIETLVNQKSKLPQEMLFTFQDLDADQIKTWFSSFAKYQTIIHLYRSLIYGDRLFIETKFLNISQALETLHSILFNNQYLSDDEFANRKEKVLQSIPEELHDWVDGALSNANFKRFRLKNFELLDKKSAYFAGLIEDKDLFAKRVMVTRNEFVHQSKHKLAFQHGKELLDTISLLKMLFELYLLEIIGFSDEKIQELTQPQKQSLLTGWKHLRLVNRL